jgi:hypothetical protein
LWFEGLGFDGLAGLDGLGGGEFAIAVWLGARGTGMEFTDFPDCGTTGGTRNREYLFGGEFFGFHHHIMQRSWL